MDKKYNIIMLAGIDVSISDGPVGHFISLSKALKELGHNVYSIAYAKKQCSNLDCFKIITAPNISFLFTMFYQIKVFFYLIIFLMKNKIDFIYIRSHYAMFSPLLILKIFNIPIISEMNGLIIDHEGKRPKVILKIGKFIEKNLLLKSQAVIVVTSYMKKWINEHYHINLNKIFVINNAANPKKFEIDKRESYRKKLNFTNNERVILYVGTLLWWQGVDYLIKAVDILKKTKSMFKVIIIGSGKELNNLENLVKRLNLNAFINFKGYLNSDEAMHYMCAADICVTPKVPIVSGYSPLKLYEYMAAARPIVASNLPGFEILRESGCGRLFTHQDEHSLANELDFLLNKSDKELHDMGMIGRKKIEEEFNWNNVAKKTISIYELLN